MYVPGDDWLIEQTPLFKQGLDAQASIVV